MCKWARVGGELGLGAGVTNGGVLSVGLWEGVKGREEGRGEVWKSGRVKMGEEEGRGEVRRGRTGESGIAGRGCWETSVA